MLLQKALKTNFEKVHYLKNTEIIVKTRPENDLLKLFMQRVRWASKTTSYKNTYAKVLAVVVLLINLSLVGSVGFVLCGCLKYRVLLTVFCFKYLVDYCLLFQSNQYVRKGKFIMPLASSLIYPLFSSLVGIYSLFGNFTWKGRKFSK